MSLPDFLWRGISLTGSALASFLLESVKALLLLLPKARSGVLAKLHASAEARKTFAEDLRKLRGRKPLWCHVASAGELEEAIPVLEQLRKDEPGLAVVLTCFSASGLTAAAREAKRRVTPWDAVGPMAPDLPFLARRFVDEVSPSRALFVHRELWPWHLRALARARVPSALIQVRATRAGRQWSAVAPWLRRFVLVGAVDESAASAMRGLLAGAPTSITTLGDARVDRIVGRLALTQNPSGRAVVLASVWPEDVKALAPAFASSELRARPLIVVPHEPNVAFIEVIEHELRAAGWALRHGTASEPLRASEAEVVTTVGGLAERYAEACVAFVGGSFRARVHNVLEPAVAGCTVVTGPLTANAPDAAAMDREGGLRHVVDAESFRRLLAEYEDDARLMTARNAARQYVEQRQGAGERSATALRNAWGEIPL